jgi:hypothetical protein
VSEVVCARSRTDVAQGRRRAENNRDEGLGSPRNIIVPQELLRFISFVHVSTASQATPTLPTPWSGGGVKRAVRQFEKAEVQRLNP